MKSIVLVDSFAITWGRDDDVVILFVDRFDMVDGKLTNVMSGKLVDAIATSLNKIERGQIINTGTLDGAQ